MSSICSTGGLAPQRRSWHNNSNKNFQFSALLFHSKAKISFLSSSSSSSPIKIASSFNDDSVPPPKQTQLGYDPSEELFRLSSQLRPRDASISGALKPRSWFGPNGQYIRELPT